MVAHAYNPSNGEAEEFGASQAYIDSMIYSMTYLL